MSDDGVELTIHPGFQAVIDEGATKLVTDRTQAVLDAAVAGAPVDTGELAASLGMEVKNDGGVIVGLVGVREGADARSVGDATNTEVMRYEEHGDGHSPATHFMSDALSQARQ